MLIAYYQIIKNDKIMILMEIQKEINLVVLEVLVVLILDLILAIYLEIFLEEEEIQIQMHLKKVETLKAK